MNKRYNEEEWMNDVVDFGEQGGVVPAIDVAATSTFLDPEDMERTFRGELHGCYLYSRHANPTVEIFGRKLAAMEGMEAGVGVASGMAAISCALEQLIPGRGHIVSSRMVYGGTYALLANVFPGRNITTTFVDENDVSAFERAITPDTKVIYTESVSNPLLGVSKLGELSRLAKEHGLTLVVDNTFSPLILSPARYGADVIIHSCTKYISGASDMIAGAILGSQEFINSLIDVNSGIVMLTGPVMDPRCAHELYARLDHLAIRMAAHSRCADYLAAKMEDGHIKVIYPGLPHHPQHDLMKAMMRPDLGFGGIVTVDCRTHDKALSLAKRLQQERFGLYAVSLGFSHTLMSVPASSTASEIPEEDRLAMGLSEGLLRLSVGYAGDVRTMWKRFKSCYDEVVGDAHAVRN